MTKRTSQAEQRGQKLATLFLRTKTSCIRWIERSTSWAVAKGWPAWVGKIPFVVLGVVLLGISLFSILALAAIAVLGAAFLLLMGKMHESIRANPEPSILKSNDGVDKEGHAGYGYYVNGTCNYYPDDET